VRELADVANLMLASAHRLSGEGQLFAFNQQQAVGEPSTALLEQARAQLAQADQLYRGTIEPFRQLRRFGFLAYALNGLGLTARAQGYLERQQAALEPARQAYADALDHLRACSALRDQQDRNGDLELQKKMDCFCTATGAEVEQEYINLGGGEG